MKMTPTLPMFSWRLYQSLITRASITITMRRESRNATHCAERKILPCRWVILSNPGKRLILTQIPQVQSWQLLSIQHKTGHFSALASTGVAEIDDATTARTIAREECILCEDVIWDQTSLKGWYTWHLAFIYWITFVVDLGRTYPLTSLEWPSLEGLLDFLAWLCRIQPHHASRWRSGNLFESDRKPLCWWVLSSKPRIPMDHDWNEDILILEYPPFRPRPNIWTPSAPIVIVPMRHVYYTKINYGVLGRLWTCLCRVAWWCAPQ